MAKDLLAGQVIGKSELTNYDDFGNKVINFTVKMAKSLAGIVVEEVQRVVMFKALAEEAAKKVQNGDYVVFTKCKAEERTYVNLNTMRPRTVIDITANGFGVTTETEFNASKAELAKLSIDVEASAESAKAAAGEIMKSYEASGVQKKTTNKPDF